MRRIALLALVTLLSLRAHAIAATNCPKESVKDHLESARIVALVEVKDSTFPMITPGIPPSNKDLVKWVTGTATLLVLESWKGPYLAGDTFRVGPSRDLCAGIDCLPRIYKLGEKLLVFTTDLEVSSHPGGCEVMSEADASGVIRALAELAR